MAINGKTILLRPAYCKQEERKVERVRDAVWKRSKQQETEEREGGSVADEWLV